MWENWDDRSCKNIMADKCQKNLRGRANDVCAGMGENKEGDYHFCKDKLDFEFLQWTVDCAEEGCKDMVKRMQKSCTMDDSTRCSKIIGENKCGVITTSVQFVRSCASHVNKALDADELNRYGECKKTKCNEVLIRIKTKCAPKTDSCGWILQGDCYSLMAEIRDSLAMCKDQWDRFLIQTAFKDQDKVAQLTSQFNKCVCLSCKADGAWPMTYAGKWDSKICGLPLISWKGENKRFCGADGQWQKEIMTCDIKKCPKDQGFPRVEAGKTGEKDCGQKMFGAFTRKCKTDGSWGSSKNKCRNYECLAVNIVPDRAIDPSYTVTIIDEAKSSGVDLPKKLILEGRPVGPFPTSITIKRGARDDKSVPTKQERDDAEKNDALHFSDKCLKVNRYYPKCYMLKINCAQWLTHRTDWRTNFRRCAFPFYTPSAGSTEHKKCIGATWNSENNGWCGINLDGKYIYKSYGRCTNPLCDASETTSSSSTFKENEDVEINWMGFGRWYPGTVLKGNEDGTYYTKFDDGDFEDHVPFESIRRKYFTGWEDKVVWSVAKYDVQWGEKGLRKSGLSHMYNSERAMHDGNKHGVDWRPPHNTWLKEYFPSYINTTASEKNVIICPPGCIRVDIEEAPGSKIKWEIRTIGNIGPGKILKAGDKQGTGLCWAGSQELSRKDECVFFVIWDVKQIDTKSNSYLVRWDGQVVAPDNAGDDATRSLENKHQLIICPPAPIEEETTAVTDPHCLKVNMIPDLYAVADTKWTVKLKKNGEVVMQGTNFGGVKCFDEKAPCFKFEIQDTFGDGLCCNYGRGFFEIYWNNEQIHASDGMFGKTETYEGCGRNFTAASRGLTQKITSIPTGQPIAIPTRDPSKQPTGNPVPSPTELPSTKPTFQPTTLLTPAPTTKKACLELKIDQDVNAKVDTSWKLYIWDRSTMTGGKVPDYKQTKVLEGKRKAWNTLNGFHGTNAYCWPNSIAEQSRCWHFVIKDDYGDGICCDYGQGSYVLKWKGAPVFRSSGEFQSEQVVTGCASSTVLLSKAWQNCDELCKSKGDLRARCTDNLCKCSRDFARKDYYCTGDYPDPTGSPTERPTAPKTGQPTRQPTAEPTLQPTMSLGNFGKPAVPSICPTRRPSTNPTKMPTSATCLRLEIFPDAWPEDLSWFLYDGEGKTLRAADSKNGAAKGFTECFDKDNACWRFIITDQYDDGICCKHGSGYFDLFWGPKRVYHNDGNYGSFDVSKGCGAYTLECTQFTEDGEKCVFPFVEKDTIYYDCLLSTVYPGKSWCPSEVDAAKKQKKWGWCAKHTCNLGKTLPPTPMPTMPPSLANAGVLTLRITPDSWKEDISWKLYDGKNKEKRGAKHPEAVSGFEVKLDGSSPCWRLVMVDEWKNGICCDYGKGNFKLYWNGRLIYHNDGTYKQYAQIKGCGQNIDNCQTVTDSGKLCKFPFKEGTNTYNECKISSTYGPAQPYCATSVKANGEKDKWGNCATFNCVGTRRLLEAPGPLSNTLCISIRIKPDTNTIVDNSWEFTDAAGEVVRRGDFTTIADKRRGRSIVALDCMRGQIGTCYTFTMFDETGDGLLGQAAYSLLVDDKVIVQSSMLDSKEESHTFCV